MSMFDDLIPQGQPNVTVRPSRGERNMNPGNIEDGPFARSQPGYSGSDGRFARFDTADNGMAAIDALLSSYGRRGFNTPETIINRWAPPSDNNPTSNYSAYVAEGLGIQPDAPLDMNDPGVRRQVAERIAQFETGKRQNATPIPAQTRALSFDDLIPQPQEQTEGRPNITIKPTQQQTISAGDALAGGVAQGVSLNFYDELRGLMEAGGLDPKDPASLTTLLQGAYKYWSGDPEATQRYDAATSRERQTSQQAQEQQPVASIAGNVLGAVALPVGGALQAATLPGRIGRGVAVGAGTGAAYGAGEGSGLEDRAGRAAIGGLIGAGVGAVAPPIVEGVIQGSRVLARPVTTAIRGAVNPESEAARRVTGAIQRDAAADPGAVSRLTTQEFAASAQQGGPARVMDLGGDTTRALARSAANTSPEGRGVLTRAIDERFEGQGSRITNWLRSTFNYPNANAQREAIEQAAQQVNNPAYRRAMQEGSRGVWSPELQRLAGAPAIQEAANSAIPSLANRGISEGFRAPRGNPLQFDRQTGRASLRTLQNGNQVIPDLRFWDQVKRGLDSMIGKAERNADNAKVDELSQLRTHLINELDGLVTGYQQARAGAAHFFGARDALEAGQNFVTANMRNDEFRRAFAQMSATERQLFQDGFVSRFIEQIGAVGDRRSVLNQIASSPQAREKLRMVLGQQRASELEAGLRVEGIMDLARGAVQGNSTTARQLAELGFAGGAGTVGGVGAYNMDPEQVTYAALAGALLAGKRGIDTRVARRVAEMLASPDPRVLQRGVQMVARNQRMMDALRSADQRIARIGGAEAPTGAPALQSMGTGRADEEQPGVPRPSRQ